MFHFKTSSNPLTQATASAAWSVFVIGMLLIGFAFLIYVLRAVVALIFVGLFVFAGICTIGFSIKLFIASRRFDDMSKPGDDYRENVRIHRGPDDLGDL